MRILFPIAALIPFGILAASQNSEKPAETVYKNIQSFKGRPARDIIPAMRFMAASLKVGCDYCHDPNDYASEAKHEKETTRKMIELQRDINAKFFNGRNEVTCMSCHNGLTHPVGAPLPTGMAERHKRTDNSVRSTDLIAKLETAMGTAVPGLTMTGELTMEGKKHPAKLIQSQEGKQVFSHDETRYGFDGTTPWYADKGFSLKLSQEESSPFHAASRRFRATKDFERYDRVSLVGENTLRGKRVLVLRGNLKMSGVTDEIYLDAETSMPLRLVTSTRSSIGTVVSSIDFEDYRKVDGAQVPFKWTMNEADGKMFTVVFKEAKVSSDIPASAFEAPAGG